MKIRKLSLKTEDLRVESFRTDARPDGRGTIFAHDCPTYSCGGTCGASPPPSDTDTTALQANNRTRVEMTLCLPCCA
jgi:hypothetical protein